ncbi:MAG: signal recognition particle-docking protein FtsY [Gammaproteobacteria bacterium CG11_big_fil_rev_8_21_14_0_20_46_22]|nr:MAG: signal recognition particle-docking protein FtsY [Gammaproteobacteria bacterium CG12_big_fil_rev_8_21_14_0_65_46_12]PIR10290.1 MAG: signal recognition particle-docking protein FtsY [Gammaproteobacteria bacterium CG11_big_fil_rev_8_21_14_0_20_46_22]
MAFGFGKRPKETPEEKRGLTSRLRAGLSKTRKSLGEGLSTLLLGRKELDEDILEQLEETLLLADIGVDMTQSVLERLRKSLARKALDDEKALLQQLREILLETLAPANQPLVIEPNQKPFVIMMVGVNGAGKTTTTGKLAKQLQQQGHSLMLAAADTFRAAAVEQLQAWGERNDVSVVAQSSGADSAAVCFDALHSAKAKGVDILIADTAGRLHTQSHLMDELKKVVRVMQKVEETAPHEVLLILDASIGQNALQQAKQFCQAVNVTGLCITKLDGTAKGGIVFAIVHELQLPIRYIGVGETIDDLREFDAKAFVDALFEV